MPENREMDVRLKSGGPRWILWIIVVFAATAFIAPFAWMVSTSLKPANETMAITPEWLPSHPQWQNYPDAIAAMRHFWLYTSNSLFVCVMSVAGTTLSSSLAAYGFSRIEWRGRDSVFMLLLATMMIPFPVLMVPIYGLFKDLGWIGTFKPLWVPTFFAGSFNVFLLRQFFLTLPKDMSEAARIDGCSEFQVFLHIVLPLARSALLVVAFFQFIFTWNDFLGPLIYLTDENSFTLPLGLQSYESQNGGTSWNYLMAASTLVILPVIVLFFLMQRTFINGIASTGGKN
jgi:multiple sugar transport system permease protein